MQKAFQMYEEYLKKNPICILAEIFLKLNTFENPKANLFFRLIQLLFPVESVDSVFRSNAIYNIAHWLLNCRSWIFSGALMKIIFFKSFLRIFLRRNKENFAERSGLKTDRKINITLYTEQRHKISFQFCERLFYNV